jgi:hypothetical protein
MGANMYQVSKNITVTWDHATFHVKKGTIVDIPAGGPLLAAYGAGNLIALTSQQTSHPGSQGRPEIDTDNMGGGVL